MNPKISIIVPVYKVEEYLHKCIDSILNQTFTDFELILVDDGSPDRCGEICEEYAKQDDRVVVIHKENGGQSTARNAGLDIARGDYIGFIDSDDWIELDMYEFLYGLCTENDCDIANCSSTIYFKNRTVVNGGHPLIVHNRKEAMKALLEGELYDECLWTKLIRRELLKELRIPNGIMYEDTAFTYKLIHRANKVCCKGESKYNYIKRDNSTMDRAVKDLRIDAVLIYEDIKKFIDVNYPELSEIVLLKLINSGMGILNLMCKTDRVKKYRREYYVVTRILNDNFKDSIKIKEYNKNVKGLLLATKINPVLYKCVVSKVLRGGVR